MHFTLSSIVAITVYTSCYSYTYFFRMRVNKNEAVKSEAAASNGAFSIYTALLHSSLIRLILKFVCATKRASYTQNILAVLKRKYQSVTAAAFLPQLHQSAGGKSAIICRKFLFRPSIWTKNFLEAFSQQLAFHTLLFGETKPSAPLSVVATAGAGFCRCLGGSIRLVPYILICAMCEH